MTRTAFPLSPLKLLSGALVIWFGSYAAGYLLTLGVGKPLYSYIALILFALFFTLTEGGLRGTIAALNDRWLRRYFIWLLVFGAWCALAFMESSQSKIAVQSLITYVELLLMGMSFALLLYDPRRLSGAQGGFALLALFNAALVAYDFFVPTFSRVPGRGAGFYVDPNIAGQVTALCMVAGLGAVPRKFRVGFVVTCGAGVFFTFSRSSWLLWGLAVAYLGWHARSHGRRSRVVLGSITALIGLGALVGLFAGNVGQWLVGTRLVGFLDPDTLARLGVGASSLSGQSAEFRLDAALYAIHVFSSAPLLGHGIGYVYEWALPIGPHDMYLRFLAEGGMVGLLLYLALMWVLWRGAVGLGHVMVVQIVVCSFFSHNMLEQPAVVLAMVYVLAHGAVQRRIGSARYGNSQRVAAVAS